jgi:hypothetical protein
MNKSILTIAFLMGAIGCTQSDPRTLSYRELADILPGKSYTYSGTVQGHRFSGNLTFNENGNLFIATDAGDPEGGTWRINGNEICTRLAVLYSGQEQCFGIIATGETSFRTTHGFRATLITD